MRIKKKRLTWNASTSPDVSSYRLYWSQSGTVGYDSVHVELGKVTHVLLPDDIPSFPLTDRIEIGITAVSIKGNESDMVRVMLQFELADAEENHRLVRLRPGIEGWEPPLNAPILIDGLNHWIIENVYANGSLSPHTRHYIAESHYEEWTIKSRTPQEIQDAYIKIAAN
jgi:hypothetical protein